MRKFDLLRKGDSIIRVLEVQPDKVLVINCIKKSMPFWMESTQLCSYLPCTKGELAEATGVEIPEENYAGTLHNDSANITFFISERDAIPVDSHHGFAG